MQNRIVQGLVIMALILMLGYGLLRRKDPVDGGQSATARAEKADVSMLHKPPPETVWRRFTQPLAAGVESQRSDTEAWAAAHEAHLAREKKRMADEQARIAEQQAYWESRQSWIDAFPFEPVHHPDAVYDPADFDQEPGVLELDEDAAVSQKRDTLYRMLYDHCFLSAFYENPNRFSPEFEAIHGILTEEGLEADPFIWGWTFTHLVDYHKASLQDLDAPWPVDPRKTWREERESSWVSIIARLTSQRSWGQVHDDLPTAAHAEAIRERLLKEIAPEGFVKIPRFEDFTIDLRHEEKLKAGDPFLIR